MMLHRHFEGEKPSDGMTTLADLNSEKGREFVSEIFPPVEEEKPKRKTRTKTADK